MAVVLIFVFTIVFIALSVPIGISIGLSTLLAMMMTGNVGTALIAQKAFTGVDSFTLLAIPLFILSGQLMTYGGISKRLVKVADDLIGFVTGGYAMVTTVACMFFSAISGSAPATRFGNRVIYDSGNEKAELQRWFRLRDYSLRWFNRCDYSAECCICHIRKCCWCIYHRSLCCWCHSRHSCWRWFDGRQSLCLQEKWLDGQPGKGVSEAVLD